jgi:hypothetical protein
LELINLISRFREDYALLMTFDRLQRLNLLKGISFSLIFVIIAFIIFIGIVDRSILHLSVFVENAQSSSLTRNVFLAIMLSALITQSIFFYKIYSGGLTSRESKFKKLNLIPLICHFINLALIAILITQIYYESKYSKILILFTIWINTSIGISILVVLAYRFILWLRESSNKSFVVITYVTSIILFIILNGAILLYFTLGYRVGLSNITSTTEPSLIFSSPHYELSVLISILGIIAFLFLWTSSILLLIYRREKIKKKYILVIGVSLAIFLSHYAFLWGFSSLRLTNFTMFHDIYALTSIISLPLGGIFFGFTFWILARDIRISKDDNLSHKQEFIKFKQSMYLTAIGIILLILSTSPLDITRLPYPPFGMVSFTFMNVGALSFFLGIYNLATAIGASSHFRLGLMKSEFLSSIGSSQGRLSRRSNIVQILKTFKNHLLETETVQEDIDKEYIKDVIIERNRSIGNADKVTFSRGQTPIGRSWETWIELWCKWYYGNRLKYEMTDKMCTNWNQNEKNQELCFLMKTLINTSEEKIEYETKVPKGRLLFLPLINNLINFYHYPNLQSESELCSCSKSEIDNQTIVYLSVNGNEIKGIQQYRIRSNLFDILLVDHNNPTQKIETQAISEGYWIFLHSLPLGRNKIYFKVETISDERERSKKESISQNSKITEIYYYLNIVEN